MEEVLLFNSFFRLSMHALVAKIGYSPTKLCDGAQMAKFLAIFWVLYKAVIGLATFLTHIVIYLILIRRAGIRGLAPL